MVRRRAKQRSYRIDDGAEARLSSLYHHISIFIAHLGPTNRTFGWNVGCKTSSSVAVRNAPRRVSRVCVSPLLVRAQAAATAEAAPVSTKYGVFKLSYDVKNE